jgi:hypothetical protein
VQGFSPVVEWWKVCVQMAAGLFGVVHQQEGCQQPDMVEAWEHQVYIQKQVALSRLQDIINGEGKFSLPIIERFFS